MRAEVKERCAGIILSTFAAIGSTGTIAEMVELELLDYHYTFPIMNNVSPLFLCKSVLSHSQWSPVASHAYTSLPEQVDHHSDP